MYKTSKISEIFWTPRSTKNDLSNGKGRAKLREYVGDAPDVWGLFEKPMIFGSLLSNHYKIPIKPPAHKRIAVLLSRPFCLEVLRS